MKQPPSASVFSAFQLILALLFAVAGASGAGAAESGAAVLRDGASLNWRLSTHTPTPVLGVAAPSYAIWSPEGFEAPVEIHLRSNFLAFIDRWELIISRPGDNALKAPVLRESGLGEAMPESVVWRGAVEAGPPLRPGERVMATLEVIGPGGARTRSEPQDILITRYLMKRERRELNIESERRQAALDAGRPRDADFPVMGAHLEARIEDWSDPDPPRLSGARMDSLGAGAWRLSQIMPPGDYTLTVQAARPIIGGDRLVPVGATTLAAPGEAALITQVMGAAAAPRTPADGETPRKDLTHDGAISGLHAARLTPADRSAMQPRVAIDLIDPQKRYRLFKDARGRNFLETPLTAQQAFWPNPRLVRAPGRAKGVVGVGRRVVYAAQPYDRIALPHTDVLPQSLRIVIKDALGAATALRPTRDYRVNPHQGRILLTDEGRSVIEAKGGGSLEVAYRIRTLAAALEGLGVDASPLEVEGNGGQFARPNAAILSGETDGWRRPGWEARFSRWLSGG